MGHCRESTLAECPVLPGDKQKKVEDAQVCIAVSTHRLHAQRNLVERGGENADESGNKARLKRADALLVRRQHAKDV